MANNIIHVRFVYMRNPGGQQCPAGQTYQVLTYSLIGVIRPTCPNPGGQSITHYKGAMGFPANNAGAVVVYKESRRLVQEGLVARNYRPLANFTIREFQQMVAGMRRLRPAYDQLATASAANNMACMQEADELIVQLVNDCMSKVTTTENKQLQIVAKGEPVAGLGQPGVPTVYMIVPPLLLLLSAPIQWGPATTPVQVAPGVALGQLQPQVLGQVIPRVVLVPGQVAQSVTPVQPQPLINQPQLQRQVAQAALLMQGQGIAAPHNAHSAAGSPKDMSYSIPDPAAQVAAQAPAKQTVQQTVQQTA